MALLCMVPGLGISQGAWDSTIFSLQVPPAASITLDGEDNLYLISEDRTRIYKDLAAYGYDSSLVVGGKSHREEGFLELADLDVSNRQASYALDRGRQRISLLHPNLRVLQDLNLLSLNASDRQDAPQDLLIISMAANPAGELYLLNQLDNQVYVLSSFGEWSLSFGGTDYGDGALYEPAELALSADNFLFVSEPGRDLIQVFDIYGTYRYQIPADCPHPWNRFQVVAKTLILKGQDDMTLLNVQTEDRFSLPYPVSGVLDLYWGQQGIYFLTKNAVHLYPFPTRD